MQVDPVISRNINRTAVVKSCMKDRDCIILGHINFVQDAESTILCTLINTALSEAHFIVYKGIRSDQVAAVCIYMK